MVWSIFLPLLHASSGRERLFCHFLRLAVVLTHSCLVIVMLWPYFTTMAKRSVAVSMAVAGLLMMAGTSCSLMSPAASASHAPKGAVSHTVFFWLKHPQDKSQRQQVESALLRLRALPQVRSLSIGAAVPSDRPVVDDSFDVGMVVEFASVADLHAYEAHPDHLKEVHGVLLPLTKKVQVYDIQHE